MIKEIMMDGFALVMVHIMIHLGELEKAQRHGTWKFQSMNLLTLTQLKLDKIYE
jgi:hypothetical protein